MVFFLSSLLIYCSSQFPDVCFFSLQLGCVLLDSLSLFRRRSQSTACASALKKRTRNFKGRNPILIHETVSI